MLLYCLLALYIAYVKAPLFHFMVLKTWKLDAIIPRDQSLKVTSQLGVPKSIIKWTLLSKLWRGSR
jgi:hypothetical protein